jgi:hypothetical protein
MMFEGAHGQVVAPPFGILSMGALILSFFSMGALIIHGRPIFVVGAHGVMLGQG